MLGRTLSLGLGSITGIFPPSRTSPFRSSARRLASRFDLNFSMSSTIPSSSILRRLLQRPPLLVLSPAPTLRASAKSRRNFIGKPAVSVAKPLKANECCGGGLLSRNHPAMRSRLLAGTAAARQCLKCSWPSAGMASCPGRETAPRCSPRDVAWVRCRLARRSALFECRAALGSVPLGRAGLPLRTLQAISSRSRSTATTRAAPEIPPALLGGPPAAARPPAPSPCAVRGMPGRRHMLRLLSKSPA